MDEDSDGEEASTSRSDPSARVGQASGMGAAGSLADLDEGRVVGQDR
jgi:hypothetical protein